jgi:5-methyltetrahydrofolate--homocysteine methyltransferase
MLLNQDRLRKIKAQHQKPTVNLLKLEEARYRKPSFDYSHISLPEFVGVRSLSTDSNDAEKDAIIFPLKELVPFIDWSPFFHAWELRGRYPTIFNNEKYGEQAKKLFEDAKTYLDKIVNENLFTAKAVYGFFQQIQSAMMWIYI